MQRGLKRWATVNAWIVGVALVIGLMVFFNRAPSESNQTPTIEGPSVSENASLDEMSESNRQAFSLDAGARLGVSPSQELKRQAPSTNPSSLNSNHGFLLMDSEGRDWMRMNAESLRNHIVDEWHQLRRGDLNPLEQRVSEGDAEAAYLLFLYHLDCWTLPLSENEMQEVVSQVESMIQDEPGSAVRHERFLDHLIDMHEDCPSDPIQSRLRSVHWMKKSADLGHLIAAIDFASISMAALREPQIAIKHPQLIAQFKADAVDLLNRAAKTGHPEALHRMAWLFSDGVLVERDPIKALAWGQASLKAYNRLGYQHLGGWTEQMVAELEAELSLKQRNQARRWSAQIMDGLP